MNHPLNPGTLVPACLVAFLCSQDQVRAATWSGGGPTNNWESPPNWAGSGKANAGDLLTFAGLVRPITNNDFTAGTSFAGITFASGAGAFTLGGNRIVLTGDVVNNGNVNSLQTINLAVQLSGNGNRIFQTATGPVEVGGLLSGTVGLVKSGNSDLTLSGLNSYSGPTSVTAGTLRVNGDQTAATGILTVDAGASLGGTGTIGGAATIAGIHVPGASPNDVGTQTFKGGLSYTATSLFSWTLGSESTTAGFDKIDGNGTLAVNGNAIFRVVLGSTLGVLNSNFWDVNRTWSTIFTGFTGGDFSNSRLQVFDSNGAPANTGGQGQFSISGTTLTWTAVPEPSAALAGLLLGAGLLRRRRAGTLDKS